ncbi:MAG: FtsX-like permease family protein [Acutalibacter sp.]
MNKTYGKSIFRTIRGSLSRFLAILAIVALGVGFFAGLLSSPVDMRISADNYYDTSRMYDVKIVSSLGLTDEDLEAVSQVEGVENVMPAYDTDLVLIANDEEGTNYTTRMHSLPEDTSPDAPGYLNQLTLVDGRMPEKAGECVVVLTKSFTGGENWIGETLRQDPESEAVEGLENSFTVVGTVKSAAYLSMETESTTAGSGSLDLMAYTVPESFDFDYYTAFYLSVANTRELDSFSQAYDDTVVAVTDALDPLGEERSQIRYEDLVGDAQAQLDDARSEYETERADAEQELADAKQELEDGEQELADNQQKLVDAKAEIDDGWAQLNQQRDSFNSQIASAQQEINDGYAQVQSGQSKLDDGKTQVDSAQDQLDAGYAELAANETTLNESKAQLDATKSQLDALTQGKDALFQAAAALGVQVTDTSDGAALDLIARLEKAAPDMAPQFASLKEGLNALATQGTDSSAALAAWEEGNAQYEEGLAQWQAGKEKLDASQQELNTQRKSLEDQQVVLNNSKAQLDASSTQLQQSIQTAQTEFANAEAKLNDSQAQYDDGLAQLEEGRKELDDGWDEYNEGYEEAQEQFADAEDKIADAESEIREIEEGQWYVYTRDDNTSFSSYGSNADKIGAIATVFPLFFFLVAALVALTTMTRMVEEERQQVGTLKALGYSMFKIAVKYLIYAALASVIGSVIGLAVGSRLFPYIIINAYNIMYDVPRILTPFNIPFALLASLSMILCTLAVTLWACWSEVREVPATLMLPKAPKPGKRIFLEYITPIWSRMKFTHKVTARNLFRYKKRFFMTVVGIAGCTALLVTGFGVRDSVSDIVSLQYDQLNQYQLTLGLMDPSALEGRDLSAILEDSSRISDSLPAMQAQVDVVPDSGKPADSIVVFVPQDVDALPDFFQFRHRTNSQPVTFDEDAVVVTEKLCERQGWKVGDTITLKDSDGVEAQLTITDICENYIYHYVYISPKTYQSAFGKEMEVNSVLCKLPQGITPQDEEQLGTDVLKCRDVVSAQFTDTLSESFDNSIQSINSIVVVLIISAGALAFVVLYNLTNINITEREKELATIKVLGFYDGEVSAYIYRETALLTVIGTVAGLFLGIGLHQFVIRTAEIDMVMFGRSIYWPSFVWATLLTLLFSALVNLVMHHKLKNISMVESMKAPE